MWAVGALAFLLLPFLGFGQSPVATWTVTHPTTVTGVAVDPVSQRVATSCDDGNLRVFTAGGLLVGAADVSPGTIDQSRRAVAYRGFAITSEYGEAAVAIDPDGMVIRPADVPSTRFVRGISTSGRYAVADDLMCYDLVTGNSWMCVYWNGYPTVNPLDWPMAVAEAPNGEVATGDLGGTLSIWTNGTLVATKTFSFSSATALNAVDWSPDGSKLAVSTMDANTPYGLLIIDRATLNILMHATDWYLVRSVKWLADGSLIYGTSDGRLVRWDGVSVTAPVVMTPTEPTPGKGKGRRK